MRRNWKRILSLLLTVAMVFTMNTSVFATEPTATATGDEATVEAAETTEPAAAETVEETKETNSETTSETAEEPKTEETATTEEVAAEAAPAETTTATVEETPAVEETAAEPAAETEAVVEETTEVAPAEETVAEEAAPVVEENAEAAGAETAVSAKETPGSTGWGISCADDNFLNNKISTNGMVLSVNEATTSPIYLTPGDDAQELKISGNGVASTPINIVVSANNNIVHSVIISANCEGISVKSGEGVIAYTLNGGSYAKVDNESGGAKWTSGEDVKVVFAKADIPTEAQKIITLSNNGKEPEKITSEVKIDGTVWDYDNGNLKSGEKITGNYRVETTSSANVVISANDGNKIKLYMATVSLLSAPARPVIKETTEDSLTVSINSSVIDGYEYVFGARADGEDTCTFSEEVTAEDGKVEATIGELESNTSYTVSGWILGHEIDSDGVVLTGSNASNASYAGKTKFGIDGIINEETFKLYGISRNGAKFSVSYNNEKFSAKFAAISGNDGVTDDDITNGKVNKASWNGFVSQEETLVKGLDGKDLVPGTDYHLWVAIGDEKDNFNGSTNYDFADLGSFSTVEKYALDFEESMTSVPLRTTDNIDKIVGDVKLYIYTGEEESDPIAYDSEDAKKYAASENAVEAKSLEVEYNIASVNSADPITTATSENNLFDRIKNAGSAKYAAFKTYYKENMPLSLNGVLDLSSIDDSGDSNATGTVAIKLTNSTVTANPGDVTVEGDDHRIDLINDITYDLVNESKEEIQDWKDVYDIVVTSANALDAFTTTNVKGPAVNQTTVYAPGNTTISIKDAKLLSWNVADDRHGEDDWAYPNDTLGIEFVASKDAATFYVVPSANDSVDFSVAGASVPYGTKADYTADGSNNKDFIKKYLVPTMTVSGTTLDYSKNQYAVKYKLLSENKLAPASWNNAVEWSGFSGGLKNLDAGTKVYAYISANVVGQTKLYKNAIAELTITKRDITLSLNAAKNIGDGTTKNDISLSYNRLRDRTQSFADKSVSMNNDELWGAVTTTLVKSDDLFDTDKLTAKYIVSDNSTVTLAGSALDVTQAGFKAVDMTYVAASQAKNFNVTSSKAWVYVNGSGTYYAQFYAYIDGKQVYSKKMNLTGAGGTNLQSVIEKDADRKELMNLVTDTGSYSGSMNGLASGVDGKEVRLTGWEIIRTDESGAQYDYYIDGDGDKWSYGNSKYVNNLYINANNDYIITAILSKYVNGENGVYVNTIKDVTYTGQSHQSDYWGTWNFEVLTSNKQKPKYNSASTLYDLDITVANDDGVRMYEGVDYTVKIKNSKNASVKYDPITGEYTQLNTNAKKMPQAIITGKGDYKGFKATVYFNILPANIGGANVTGLLDSYFWTGKKMSKKVSYKVADTIRWADKKGNTKTKSLKLKAYNTKKSTGDYQVVIYKAASGNAAWTKTSITDPNKISEKGNYLLTLEGINNYTGIKPVDLELTAPNAAELDPKVYEVGDPLQFFVETDKSFLLDGATIKLNKGLKIQDDKTYISYNQVISDVVANKKSVSKDGYEAYFSQYDPVDKSYKIVYEKNKDGEYVYDDNGELVKAISINEAGKYTVTVYAKEGGQYHGSQTSKAFTVKGVKLSAKDLKDSIYYYYYDNNKDKYVYKPYSEVKKTGISYNGGERIYVKISGNSSVSDNYQFYTDNGSGYVEYADGTREYNNYAAYEWDTEDSEYEYKFRPGNYKVTAYGMKQYAGSKVTLSYKVAAIDLKKDTDLVGDLGSKKLIELGVYKEVSVNAGGTMPWIRISVNGVDDNWNTDDDGYETDTLSDKYKYTRPYGSGYPFSIHGMIFTVNVTKNTKVGTAKVTFKGSGAVKGSITKEFSVIENKWNAENVGSKDNLIDSYDNKSWTEGRLYADVQDEMNAGTKEPKYKVDLYQAYYGKYDAKNNKAKLLYKKLGSSTKEKATAYFTPDFQTVSSGSASGNTSVTMSVNFANGTKSEMSFDKSIYAAEKWSTWTDKTPNITSVVVSFNGHKNEGKTFTIPTVPTLDYTGEKLDVIAGDYGHWDYYYYWDEDEYVRKWISETDIYKRDKDGNIMYVNEKGELTHNENDTPLYADSFVVKVGSTTISQNYVITSQTPSPAIKDGTVKFTVKLVKRVPESVEKYTYGGKSKTFTYKIKKASDTAL